MRNANLLRSGGPTARRPCEKGFSSDPMCLHPNARVPVNIARDRVQCVVIELLSPPVLVDDRHDDHHECRQAEKIEHRLVLHVLARQ